MDEYLFAMPGHKIISTGASALQGTKQTLYWVMITLIDRSPWNAATESINPLKSDTVYICAVICTHNLFCYSNTLRDTSQNRKHDLDVIDLFHLRHR